MEHLTDDWREFRVVCERSGLDRRTLNRRLYTLAGEGKVENTYSAEKRSMMWRRALQPTGVDRVQYSELGKCVRNSEVVDIMKCCSRGKVISVGENGAEKEYAEGDWIVHYPSSNRVEVWRESDFVSSGVFGPKLS